MRQFGHIQTALSSAREVSFQIHLLMENTDYENISVVDILVEYYMVS